VVVVGDQRTALIRARGLRVEVLPGEPAVATEQLEARIRTEHIRAEERSRAAAIARAQPFYPDTTTGRRQAWMREQIALAIESPDGKAPERGLDQAELLERIRAEERERIAAWWDDTEARSAEAHDVYQREAHRRGDIRHPDAYADLSEATKEWDRVLVRWVAAAIRARGKP
jgi:hypothetical protein